MYILYIVTNDTLKKGSAFILNQKNWFVYVHFIQFGKYIHINIFARFGLFSCIMDIYETNFIMMIDFTEAELETIAAAMDDYMCYADDEFASKDDLIGGLSVETRVLSIQNKIDTLFIKMRG